MSINIAVAVEQHYLDIEKIDEALREAENFGDRKIWFELNGNRQLLHVTELDAMRQKEEQAIKAILAGRRVDEAASKTVDGKSLTASSFAYVGDPTQTDTWKFPIYDADHVRNALARFNQGDLPADAKKGVLAKIHAAAKKFGIDVSEPKS
jgi:hypothetical protein